jgi:hypothetical protein
MKSCMLDAQYEALSVRAAIDDRASAGQALATKDLLVSFCHWGHGWGMRLLRCVVQKAESTLGMENAGRVRRRR